MSETITISAGPRPRCYPMTTTQAINLALLLLEFEAENALTRSWRLEVRAAARELQGLLNRGDCAQPGGKSAEKVSS